MNDIPEGFRPSEFSCGFLGATGPFYLKPDGAGVIIGLRVTQTQLNMAGLVHGGMMATLADVTLAQQIYVSQSPPIPMVTTSLTTNFLAAAKLGDWIEGRGRIDRIGGRIAYASGELLCGEEILMTMTGVFTLLRKR